MEALHHEAKLEWLWILNVCDLIPHSIHALYVYVYVLDPSLPAHSGGTAVQKHRRSDCTDYNIHLRGSHGFGRETFFCVNTCLLLHDHSVIDVLIVCTFCMYCSVCFILS